MSKDDACLADQAIDGAAAGVKLAAHKGGHRLLLAAMWLLLGGGVGSTMHMLAPESTTNEAAAALADDLARTNERVSAVEDVVRDIAADIKLIRQASEASARSAQDAQTTLRDAIRTEREDRKEADDQLRTWLTGVSSRREAAGGGSGR